MKKNKEESTEKKVYKNTKTSYEEISEKKTSKLGYILLTIMVIFVIGVGETIFSDLGDIPEKPESPASCVTNTAEYMEKITYISCPSYTGFGNIDEQFNLDTQFESISRQIDEIILLNDQISDKKYDINGIEDTLEGYNQAYGLSLQERIANEPPILDKDNLKEEILDTKVNNSNLENELNNLINKRNTIITEITPTLEALDISYEEALDSYKTQNAWYRFKVFLLTLIFVLPFFVISVKYYLEYKRKNSPYTIILTATTTAFSILFVQVMGVFLYDILPKEWLNRVFTFLLDIPLLSYIVYYGSVIIILGIFGGIVYYIQKKVYDPAKVAVRRLKDKKCPGCSFTLDSDHKFCPDCGLQLKETCGHCKKEKIRYLSHCPNCGQE